MTDFWSYILIAFISGTLFGIYVAIVGYMALNAGRDKYGKNSDD